MTNVRTERAATSDSFAGGCACAAVRYDIAAQPVAMGDCQCRQCQQRSGTGHGSYLAFAMREAVKLTGQAREWDVTGDGGTLKRHAFCGTCGTPVFLTFPALPELFIVHAGSLDDPSRYQLHYVTYTRSGQAWDAVAPALAKFETMPPRADADGGNAG